MEDAHREALEEAAQAAPGVDPDVTSQLVPQRVGQVVDQRDVAEAILAPPEDAVGLPEPEAVGGKDDDAPADLCHPVGFAHGLAVVVHVLQDFVEQDHVEKAVGEGQFLGGGGLDVGQLLAGLGHLLWVHVHPVDLVAEAAESLNVHP